MDEYREKEKRLENVLEVRKIRGDGPSKYPNDHDTYVSGVKDSRKANRQAQSDPSTIIIHENRHKNVNRSSDGNTTQVAQNRDQRSKLDILRATDKDQ
ncbi:hypothetical protein KIN20_033024 [Parelaphostrongylus tenuis]|uniref:Uncharacterized protein n=1 Tax=Parelaphostrongylus tenuis TaxID=148309 RepID=A0AAD5WIX4_PARTN|nr:hypothetical protein KIN20_033024 [Parelaphostrongylus tenuis]